MDTTPDTPNGAFQELEWSYGSQFLITASKIPEERLGEEMFLLPHSCGPQSLVLLFLGPREVSQNSAVGLMKLKSS